MFPAKRILKKELIMKRYHQPTFLPVCSFGQIPSTTRQQKLKKPKETIKGKSCNSCSHGNQNAVAENSLTWRNGTICGPDNVVAGKVIAVCQAIRRRRGLREESRQLLPVRPVAQRPLLLPQEHLPVWKSSEWWV